MNTVPVLLFSYKSAVVAVIYNLSSLQVNETQETREKKTLTSNSLLKGDGF